MLKKKKTKPAEPPSNPPRTGYSANISDSDDENPKEPDQDSDDDVSCK